MKKMIGIVFCCICCCGVYANDTIPILNTIFYGIDVLFGGNDTVIVTNPAPATTIVQPSYPQVVVPGTLDVVYVVNDQYMIINNGRYVPYYGGPAFRPGPPPPHRMPPPPPPHHRGRGPRGGRGNRHR